MSLSLILIIVLLAVVSAVAGAMAAVSIGPLERLLIRIERAIRVLRGLE